MNALLSVSDKDGLNDFARGLDSLGVTIYATVQSTLGTGPQLVLRDTQSSNRIRVYAADDFVIR